MEGQWEGLLDCDRPRKFWIHWSSSSVSVGHGFPYEDELLSLPDSDPYLPIDVSFDSDLSYRVQYEFSTESGLENLLKISISFMKNTELFSVEMTQVQTTGTSAFDAFWQTVMGRERFLLQVRACSDVIVLLASSAFIYEDALELHIVNSGLKLRKNR